MTNSDCGTQPLSFLCTWSPTRSSQMYKKRAAIPFADCKRERVGRRHYLSCQMGFIEAGGSLTNVDPSKSSIIIKSAQVCVPNLAPDKVDSKHRTCIQASGQLKLISLLAKAKTNDQILAMTVE